MNDPWCLPGLVRGFSVLESKGHMELDRLSMLV